MTNLSSKQSVGFCDHFKTKMKKIIYLLHKIRIYEIKIKYIKYKRLLGGGDLLKNLNQFYTFNEYMKRKDKLIGSVILSILIFILLLGAYFYSRPKAFEEKDLKEVFAENTVTSTEKEEKELKETTLSRRRKTSLHKNVLELNQLSTNILNDTQEKIYSLLLRLIISKGKIFY